MYPSQILRLFVAVVASSSPLFAQSVPAVQGKSGGGEPSPEVAQAIADTDARLQNALAKRDRAALEALTADPFTWIHGSDGRVGSREVWLASAAQGAALSGQRNVRTEYGVTLAAYGSPEPHTVVRIARVRLHDADWTWEIWMRQSKMYVRSPGGAWLLASAQGTLMYEGAKLDPVLHSRYDGTYEISPGRTLVLTWDGESLLSVFPNGAVTQVFLASPTEEAVRTVAGGELRFTLDGDGRPVAATLVRRGEELWRAVRRGS